MTLQAHSVGDWRVNFRELLLCLEFPTIMSLKHGMG